MRKRKKRSAKRIAHKGFDLVTSKGGKKGCKHFYTNVRGGKYRCVLCGKTVTFK